MSQPVSSGPAPASSVPANIGFDVPAAIGMTVAEVETPCLIIDLDRMEGNMRAMARAASDMGVRLRPHAKTHKSPDIARLQQEIGGACGICCQKVSEAEVFARAGITDILVSNQVRGKRKAERLARLPLLGARTIVCVDDPASVAELSQAAVAAGSTLECLVEIECGAGRCGVPPGRPVLDLARAITNAPGLRFAGIQAYQGAAQHIIPHGERQGKIDIAIEMVRQTLSLLAGAGIPCDIIGGAGTGSYEFEGGSGLYNELQCGSYIFMDVDYQTIQGGDGALVETFDNALFILTEVMSTTVPDRAVCDAGLKVQSVDSGLPRIHGRADVKYIGCSDEHGTIADPDNLLRVGDRLHLVPGHCDPTCNIHDWYVGVRDGIVETVWPVTARGKAL